MRDRLAEEAAVAGKYGTGAWSFFRGALSELSRKGMRNRVLLIFCGFALQNFGGAGGMDFLRYSTFWLPSLSSTDLSRLLKLLTTIHRPCLALWESQTSRCTRVYMAWLKVRNSPP